MKTIIERAREAGLPEAWISENGVLKWSDLERFAALVRADERERPWVGLTDEEMLALEETTTCTGNESWLRNLTQNIEAKLKEKNT